MAIKDSVLNIVIKAQNLASEVIGKFRKDVEQVDSTSADASKSVGALGDAAKELGSDADSASTGANNLNESLDGIGENARDAAESVASADDSMKGIADAADSVGDSSTAASQSLNELGNAAGELGSNTERASTGTKTLTGSMDDIDNNAARAADSVDDLSDAAKDLGDETKHAGTGTKVLGAAMDDVDEEAAKAAAALEKAEKEAAEVARKLHETGVASDKAAASVGKMGQRFDAAGKPIETAAQELEKTKKEIKDVDDVSEKAGGSIGKFTKRLLGLAVAALGINTAKKAMTEMLRTGDQFERLSLQMEQTMGSLAAGKEATEWVKEFARNTPLQLQEVTDTFLRMKNFGLDPLDGSMQAVVDQAAKLGKGYETVEGISLALGQAWAKQKLQGEEILQLIERGVPVWDLLAKVTGKTTAELQDLSSAGMLGRDTIKALIDEMGRQSAGAAAENMSLLSGYISTLTDEWQLFLNEVAKSGALDYAKEQLRQLIEYIQELKANGELKQWAQRISDSFIAVSEASKAVAIGIKDNVGAIALLAKAYATVKLIGYVGDAKNLAVAMGVLAGRKKAVADQANLLSTAMRAIPWIFVADGAAKALVAYNQLREAKAKLAQSQATENEIQAEATDRIAEFNAQTGLAVKSLDEIIAAQNAGTVAIDEYTGKWRLATDQLTEAEKAERANIEAMKAAQQERQNYLSQIDSLLTKFNEVKTSSSDVSEAIAAIGEEAIRNGEGGLQALATAIQNIAHEGKATKEQLQTGLAAFLKELSDDQYTQFGIDLEAALKKISSGTKEATASMGAMKALIDADMRAAAQRLGVDVGEALTGIDEASKKAIAGLQELGAKLQASGVEGKSADAIIKDGLLKTLKGLDSTQEIDATVAALKSMGVAGQVSNQQLQALLATLKKQREEIVQNSTAQKDVADANEKSAGTWTLVENSSNKAKEGMTGAAGAAKFLADAYASIRGEVEALGPAALAAFEKLQGIRPDTSPITGDFADLKQTIADTSVEIDNLKKTATFTDFTGINTFLRDASINAALVKQEYAEQKLAIDRLQAAYANGSISAQQFINSTRGAAGSTSLLNQSDLSALKNQIRAAQDQMDSFRESTEGTLNSLQSELAQLQGNADRVARLAYESRVADLENQLADARKTGDKEAIANAQEALRVAKEIYQIKQQQIAEEKREAERQKAESLAQAEQEKQTQNQNQAQQPATPVTQQPLPANGPVQRVEIALPNGRTANLSGSVDDVNNFLEFLTQAGMRSL